MQFYAIEGLDGVGKTTLIQNLAKKGFLVYKTPPEIYNHIRKELHNLKETSLFYYLSSLCYVIEVEAKNKNNFFIDRFIFSTLTQYVSNTTMSINDLRLLFKQFLRLINPPTITFFIDLNYENRIERIKSRTPNERFLDNYNKKYNDFWVQAMYEYDFSKKVILDGEKTEEELVNEVILHLKGYNA